ncbi:MAG: universal stress protein [Desulfuromonadaceae bacterium]|nr:universal stress protein [Desulfuromonadaceae bacterium]
MAFKDLLLHIDHSPSYLARLELAINLARTHGAHLKGIYAVSHAYYTSRDELETADLVRKAEILFTERTTHAGISAEWLHVDCSVVGASIAGILNRYTYYTDLVIVGQPDTASNEPNTAFDLPEQLGLRAGCPLLIVPRTGSFHLPGTRVMIAWKSGREASRSVKDSMPILKKAQQVSVVTISPFRDDSDIGLENVRKISSYLALHQVPVGHEQIFASSVITVGDLLLNHVFELKMDLLVMGAYSASRSGGIVLSPVAKHLMNHMTVPMLFSH